MSFKDPVIENSTHTVSFLELFNSCRQAFVTGLYFNADNKLISNIFCNACPTYKIHGLLIFYPRSSNHAAYYVLTETCEAFIRYIDRINAGNKLF
jgi:hypothetical protein